jgi:hypothetical protein
MGLSLEGKNTHMENNIPIETRIAMGLAWLGSGNSLQMCGKVYNIAKNTSIITWENFV